MSCMGYLKDKGCDPFRDEKALLMRGMLRHVPRWGWSVVALRRAAEDTSVPDAELIFASARAYDYVCAAFDVGEQQLAEDLQKAQQGEAWSCLPVREKIARGVRLRLEPWSEERPAFRRAVLVVMQPQHFLHTTRCLYETLDKIWRAAGDRSVDHNFYTKRAILALVYVPTLFLWLRDRSEGCSDTWDFLAKRIDRALVVGRRMGKFSVKSFGKPFCRGKDADKGGSRTPWQQLRLTAGLLRATFVKGKMHAKP